MSLANLIGKSIKRGLDKLDSSARAGKNSNYVSPSNPKKPYYPNPGKSGNDFLNPINNPSPSSNNNSSGRNSSGSYSSNRERNYVNPSPAVNKPTTNQYQYANYDSNNNFLGYTTGGNGRSNAMGNASYVVAPNGQKYNTGFTSSNQGNNNSVNFDGRIVNRNTRNNNISSLSGYNNVLGWNDKSNDRLNLSYLPEGLTLPSDGNFSVGSHVLTGADGNALRDSNGNPLYEYRPHVYYDANGKASFSQENKDIYTKEGRKQYNSEAYGITGDWGYDNVEVRNSDTSVIRYKHPVTGKWIETTRGMGEDIWRNLVEGGYYSESDKNNNFQVVDGKTTQSLDLENTNKHLQNIQNRNQMNNDMYNANPEMAVQFRIKQTDDWLRYQNYLNTGINLPTNHFITQEDMLNKNNIHIAQDKELVNRVMGNLRNTVDYNPEQFKSYLISQGKPIPQQPNTTYETGKPVYNNSSQDAIYNQPSIQGGLPAIDVEDIAPYLVPTLPKDDDEKDKEDKEDKEDKSSASKAISKYLRELEKASQKK